MNGAPSVLLLDDAELKRVRAALVRLGADFVHLHAPELRAGVPKPRDLLLTNWRRALELPKFECSEQEPSNPTWVCFHNQEFSLAGRKYLRGLGAHFLVHTQIDTESLRLLFGQLLYRGQERRGTLRLPIGCEIRYRTSLGSQKAALVDLSMESCRFVSPDELQADTPVTLELPAELFDGPPVELTGSVLRCAPYEARSHAPGFSVVIAFQPLEPQARKQLEDVLEGRGLGAWVAPLEFDHEPEPEILLEELADERRSQPRRSYPRRVVTFSSEAPEKVVLGHDLSPKGVRIAGRAGLELGSQLTLALYGRSREEPVVVHATLVADHGESGMGLEFVSLTPEQKQELEKLIAHLPPLESLQDGRPDGESLVISRIVSAER